MTRVTKGTEDPRREDPKEHLVPRVCQVIPVELLTAKTVVMVKGDPVAFPVLSESLGLPVPPD